jgi:hypothetical protein
MSRGLGYVQRYVFILLMNAKKPMTFAEILAQAYPDGSFESDMAKVLGNSNVGRVRSLRRALHKGVKDEVIMTIGKGGRAEPHRYCIAPIALAMLAKDNDEFAEMMQQRSLTL